MLLICDAPKLSCELFLSGEKKREREKGEARNLGENVVETRFNAQLEGVVLQDE